MTSQSIHLYFKSRLGPLPVGTLSVEADSRQGQILYFAYDSDWLHRGFSLGRDLPLVAKVFKSTSRQPYFGFLYDIIPGVGERRFAKVVHKKPLENIELLLKSQETLRPGALGFNPAHEVLLQARDMGKVALDLERLMLGHTNISDIEKLYNGISGLPGEHFKLGFVKGKNKNVISKFTLPDPDRTLIIWEAIALALAKRAGLTTVSAELTSFRSMPAIVAERFDRDEDGHPIAFATAGALLGVSPDSFHTYLEVADIINAEGSRPKTDLNELWLRMVFNMAIGNTNDRLDNIGFIREEGGWHLSPIYSLQPTPLPLARRHHATGVTTDCDSPDLSHAIEVAPYFGLNRRKAQLQADEITAFVNQNWEKIARDFGADPLEMDVMAQAFERLPR